MPNYPTRARLSQIPDGDSGTRATLNTMAHFIRERRVDPVIRQRAESIIDDVAEKDAHAEAAAVHAWVRDNIRYTGDVAGVETLKDPLLLLQSRHGDCDDKSTLAAALLQSIGFPVALIAVAFEGDREFSHVYCEAEIDGVLVPVETTEAVPLGWRAPGVTRFMRVYV